MMPKLTLKVTGQPITFLVDSGATDSVIIGKELLVGLTLVVNDLGI